MKLVSWKRAKEKKKKRKSPKPLLAKVGAEANPANSIITKGCGVWSTDLIIFYTLNKACHSRDSSYSVPMVITHLRYCIVLHLPAGGGGEEKKKKERQTFTSGVKKKAPEPCID